MNIESFDLEQVYDEQIAPLVKQVIELCIHHRIPMLASFHYATASSADGGEVSGRNFLALFPERPSPHLLGAAELLDLLPDHFDPATPTIGNA